MNNDFYGDACSKRITYLEFGEINLGSSEKKVYDFKLHQTAYDWFMLSRYANDIFILQQMRHLLEGGEEKEWRTLFKEGVHHENELCLALGKLAALYASGKKTGLRFFELGQTLFGCIEAMEFCQAALEFKDLCRMDEVDWLGVDTSQLFNEFARKLHSGYRVRTALPGGELPRIWDIFYAKGITLLYAIRQLDELYAYINASKCAYFDYSFSLCGIEESAIGTGKAVRYLDFKEFLSGYPGRVGGKVIYVNTQTSKISPERRRVRFDFFISGPHEAERFLQFEKNVISSIGCSDAGRAEVFMNCYHDSWVRLEDFIQTNDHLIHAGGC